MYHDKVSIVTDEVCTSNSEKHFAKKNSSHLEDNIEIN